jgi:Predicted hydrolases or acyltransferases (alpha/beta hydrolase superfamily)
MKLLQRDFPLSAFVISLAATVLVLAEGFLWVAQQSAFVAQFNAEDLLFHFGPAALMALCTVLLLRRPVHNRLLGVGIGFAALLSLLAGGGFLAGLMLGLVGAVLAITWNSKRRIVAPLQNRLLKLSRRNRAFVLLAVAAIAVMVVIPTEVNYQISVNTAQQNLLSGSKVINTAHGPIEYVDVGSGIPVLVSHGAGMGYMQLGSIEAMLGNESFRLIVPSRYGYLRTPMQADSSFAAQADSFADLLDALNISKVVIMGVSIGGPAALQFAIRHPDRCSALIMASAISHNTPDFDAVGLIMHHVVFRSDFGFYTLSTTYQPLLLQFLGVPPEVQANMTDADKQYVNDMISAMQPIGLRQDGLINDAERSQTELNLDLTQIHMPTLVFHAKDDGLVNYEYGQYTASQIPNAEFVSFEHGGHLLVGCTSQIHDKTVSFLKENGIMQ